MLLAALYRRAEIHIESFFAFITALRPNMRGIVHDDAELCRAHAGHLAVVSDDCWTVLRVNVHRNDATPSLTFALRRVGTS